MISRIHRQRDRHTERSSPSSLSTLVYCRFPPSKDTSVTNLEACCKGLSIIELLGLSCIKPGHPTLYKPMGYTAKGFVKGDTRLEFDVGSFVKSSTIDLVFGYLFRSGLHDQFVTVQYHFKLPKDASFATSF